MLPSARFKPTTIEGRAKCLTAKHVNRRPPPAGLVTAVHLDVILGQALRTEAMILAQRTDSL